MELIDLYKSIKNPIDDKNIIIKIIEAYSNSSKEDTRFYSKLIRTIKEQNTKIEYSQKDADMYYSMIFNKWKNSLTSLTKEEYKELYKQGIYDKDYITLRKYLLNINDIKSQEEEKQILNVKDDQLQEIINRYIWSRFGEDSSWTHVCSKYLTAFKHKYPNIEHRLYLNIDSKYLYKLLTLFTLKCDKYNIPYYYKFDINAKRDDNFVVYSDSNTLIKYIEILNEIKNENPYLNEGIKRPPILSGVINNFIGYGSEPEETYDGELQSYNGLRSDHLEEIITEANKKWILNHKDKQFQNTNKTYKEYITDKTTKYFLKKLNEITRLYDNLDEQKENLGYTQRELNSPKFKEATHKIILDKIDTMLKQINQDNMGPLIMNVRDKQIVLSEYDFNKILKEEAITFSNQPDYINYIQNQIKTTSKEYGIDPNNYAFDIRIKKKIGLLNIKNKLFSSIPKINKNKESSQTNTKIDIILNILKQCSNNDIKIVFKDGKTIMTIYSKEYIINNEDEFINLFNYYLDSLSKISEKYINLDYQLLLHGYPNKIESDISFKR